MANCITINSDEKRRNLIAMLSGDAEQVESLVKQNNGKPLPVFDVDWGDQWDLYGLTKWERDINSLEDEDLKTISSAMFNAAASQRMLYIIDKYITDEARGKGEELMRKYDAYHPILRHKPDELIDEIQQ
jgi:hypothetical protein